MVSLSPPPGVPHCRLPPEGDLSGLPEGHRRARCLPGLPRPHPSAGELDGTLGRGRRGCLPLTPPPEAGDLLGIGLGAVEGEAPGARPGTSSAQQKGEPEPLSLPGGFPETVGVDPPGGQRGEHLDAGLGQGGCRAHGRAGP